MFRRLNRIAITTGLSVAVIAAMAGPASDRAAAATPASPAAHPPGRTVHGHPQVAAAPGTRPASTLAPVDVTGDITWTNVESVPNTTGGDTQTGTVHIALTNVNGTGVPGDTSTYSISNNMNMSGSQGSDCTWTQTGSSSGSGSLPFSNTGNQLFEFQIGSSAADITIQIPYDETDTITYTGTAPGCTGSQTFDNPGWATPTCYNQGRPIGMSGNFAGTYPNGTVNIACSGTTQDIYNDSIAYNVTGTLTVTPACGGAAAPSHNRGRLTAASSCGLSITSPPANSTIAATDPNYLQLQPGPDERQPEERNLAVHGDAPPGDSSITLNGQQVPVENGTWTADVPVTAASLGQLTLTASDANFTDEETITLIDLQITAPTEGTSWPITAEPAMPELNATVSAVGYPGDTSNVSFHWALNLRGNFIDRHGWHSYPFPGTPITGTETGTQTPWNLPQDSPIIGGVGRLSVSADLPGVLDDPVQSEPRWINIPGNNPDPAAVNDKVVSLDSADADTIEHIFCHESGGKGINYPQFNPVANRGEPGLAVIPADWSPNPPVMQPKFGADPAGIGIAQDDPATFPAQQWNWIANVTRGVQVYRTGLGAAESLLQDEQDRLNSEWQKARDVVDAYRKAHHLGNVNMPKLVEIPAEPAPYAHLDGVTADAITRYNTGPGYSLFYFGYHYLATTNNLHVVTQGTPKWVKQDGKWGTSGTVYTAPTWKINPKWDPFYPDHVENCQPPQ